MSQGRVALHWLIQLLNNIRAIPTLCHPQAPHCHHNRTDLFSRWLHPVEENINSSPLPVNEDPPPPANIPSICSLISHQPKFISKPKSTHGKRSGTSQWAWGWPWSPKTERLSGLNQKEKEWTWVNTQKGLLPRTCFISSLQQSYGVTIVILNFRHGKQKPRNFKSFTWLAMHRI